jgi:Ser/Thr protein kinase RdoA (MazF antagonist)
MDDDFLDEDGDIDGNRALPSDTPNAGLQAAGLPTAGKPDRLARIPSADSTSIWGGEETKFFFELTPEKILEAVEASGLECTGRCLQLNSMENRVFEVEVVLDSDTLRPTAAERFRVVKFYRPGRWSKAQIQEEHSFLLELAQNEIPVVPPSCFPDGATIHQIAGMDIYYTVFPKKGGRLCDELDKDQLEQVGRLLARLHGIGATKKAEHRLSLTPASFGFANLDYLIQAKILPPEIESSYSATVTAICEMASPWFEATTPQRIHGDCHAGNILWGTDGAFVVDFDDMVTGPPVQDIWLLLSGNEQERKEKLGILLTAYEQMREFDYSTIRLIPALRALRMVHFSAWIGKRWNDPAFSRVFSDYGSARYWSEELIALREQLGEMQSGGFSIEY